MKLSGIAWHGYSLPFSNKYVTSESEATSRCGLLLFLVTNEGIVGIGEASPVGASSPEEVGVVAEILEKSAPDLLEVETRGLENGLPEWNLPTSPRFGIETALLDIKGQAEGLPVAALLGSKPSSLFVNALIAPEALEQAVLAAREAIEQGFTSLKLKVGGGLLEEDEKLVSAVREAVGSEVKLRLDPNQAWSVKQAIESIGRLSRFQIEYVEQPIAASDVAGLAEVRRSVPVPLAADESLSSIEDLQNLLDTEAADIFIIKAAKVGGINAGMEIANEAIKAGRSVVVTTSLESGVGIAAGTHLAAAFSEQPYSHGLATGLLFEQDLTYPLLLPEKGRLMTPERPGLGVKVGSGLLKKYGTEVIGSVGSLFGLQEYLNH